MPGSQSHSQLFKLVWKMQPTSTEKVAPSRFCELFTLYACLTLLNCDFFTLMPKSHSDDTPIPDFSPTQLHILQILWDADHPLKPGEIEERFEWPIENATLRSVLSVLMERGEIERERKGKAYVYRPKREKHSALSDFFAGMAQVFSGGSRAGLIAQLLQDDSLTPDEIRELEALAEEVKPDSSTENPNPPKS